MPNMETHFIPILQSSRYISQTILYRTQNNVLYIEYWLRILVMWTQWCYHGVGYCDIINWWYHKPICQIVSWIKRGKRYANNGLCLWSDVYQDHGLWLVCLHQLDLLVVKWPVKLCDLGFKYCHLPMGSWTQGFRKNQWAAGNQGCRNHGYIYSKCWVSLGRVSLLTTKLPMVTPIIIHFLFGNTSVLFIECHCLTELVWAITQ